MYFIYTKKYKCVFIVFSRCWSKTIIKWIADLEEIPISIPKLHNECVHNNNICMNLQLYKIYENPKYVVYDNNY